MQYRAEIDGLRALAVIPVILFHAGFSSFNGGFVGVDIFFVISGYLITGIIVKDLEQGSFSLLHFYERRARRILPALFLVMMVSFPVAWMLLLPGDMREFTRNLVAVVFFSANFIFWKDTGYWSTDAELNPLLHTWSLAIEEQFYLVFPLVLLTLWRWRRRHLLKVLLLTGCASLFFAQWSSINAPAANYFLLPTRAWELLLGALVALVCHRLPGHPATRDSAGSLVGNLLSGTSTQVRPVVWLMREVAGVIGLGLICYAVFYFNENTPFPGFMALLPTVGTALLLVSASSKTLVGRLLAQRILVGAGLVSYSAYLWHQPLLAFARYAVNGDLETVHLLGLIAATFVLAGFSWYFVERPFRQDVRIPRDTLYKSALACVLAFIAVGIAGDRTYGFLHRSADPDSFLSDARTRINFGLDAECDGNMTSQSRCWTSEEPEILVWGDSYAMHLVQGILASKPDAGIVQMTRSSCAPVFDLAVEQGGESIQSCLEFTDQVKNRIDTMPSLRYAVLSSPFNVFFRDDSVVRRRDGTLQPASLDLIDAGFRESLDYLESRGITPVVFSPTPRNGDINTGQCLKRAEYFGRSLDACNFPLENGADDQQQVFSWLRDLAADYPVVFLDEMICPQGVCRAHREQQFIYRDHGHLSITGSKYLGAQSDFYALITGKQQVLAGF